MISIARTMAVMAATALLAPAAYAGTIDLELHGLVSANGGDISDYGYGSEGLYLGDDWKSATHPYTNWEWKGVHMSIESNGDAKISGEMTRGDGSVWGLEMKLWDARIVGDAIDSLEGDWVWDLYEEGEYGAGLSWRKLEMTLTAPYDTAVPEDGWKGKKRSAWDKTVAELVYKDGDLVFDAWYKNPKNDRKCGGWWKDEYCYNVGDSKAVAKKKGTKPIPEPSAALVFATGAFVTGVATRRRRN